MFKINKIKMTNFLSFQEAELLFDGKVTIINGQNLDDQGQYSNGSGKSGLLESIYFSLIGSSMRGIQVRQLIKRNCDFCSVELVLTSANQTLTITRTLSAKKPQTLTIFVDQDEKLEASVLELNKWLLSFLGIDEDVLCHYLVTRDKFEPFLRATDTQKKELLISLSGHQVVDMAVVKVKSQAVLLTSSLGQVNSQLAKTQGKLEHLVQTLTQLKTPSISFQELSEALTLQLKLVDETYLSQTRLNFQQRHQALKLELVESQQVLDRLKAEYTLKYVPLETQTAKLQVEEPPAEILTLKANRLELLEIYQDFKTSKEELEQTKRHHEHELIVLNRLLVDAVVCPKCQEQILINSSLSKDQVQLNIKSSTIKLQELKLKLDSVALKLVSVADLGNQLKAQLQKLVDTYDQELSQKKQLELRLASLSREYRRDQIRLEGSHGAITASIAEVTSKLAQLELQKKAKLQELSNEALRVEINEQNRLKSIVDTQELMLKVDLELLTYLAELKNIEASSALKLKDIEQLKLFKSWLGTRTLATIEKLTNRQLDLIGSSLQLKLEGFKEASSGDLKDKINSLITRNGVEFFSYGSLSAGEKARMDLATMLAIQQLTGFTTKSKLNFLTIDEVLDSVDQAGIQEIMLSLHELPQQFLVVSQHEPVNHICSLITVTKEHGRSTIKASS